MRRFMVGWSSLTRGRAPALAAAVIVLAHPVAAAAGDAPAQAPRQAQRDGLRTEALSTFSLDPAAGVVHVSVEMTITNTVADRRDGNVIEQTYFSAVTIPVIEGAANVTATNTDGAPLTTTTGAADGIHAVTPLEIELDGRLFHNETTGVVVTYDIMGLPPRSESPARANAAYMAFSAYTVGDPGLSTVEVRMPVGLEHDTLGPELSESVEGDTVTLRADAIEDPATWVLFVMARNDGALVSTPLTVEDAEFDVRAWPGDDAWVASVTTNLTSGLPAMTSLIGQPWPIDETVEVREAVTPYIYGYSGWFNAALNEIEIGEDLDQTVVLHELSHAWFNRDLFDERWLNEGFAQTYAALTIAAIGGVTADPPAVTPGDPGSQPLAGWSNPTSGADDASEAYGYGASWMIIDGLVDEIGVDAARNVIAALATDQIAYPGDGSAEDDPNSRVTWRRLLDVAEGVGGSTRLEDALRAYVVAERDLPTLDARADARAMYETVEAKGGEWAVPLSIREQMATWEFDDATDGLTAAGAALAARDELGAAAAELGVAAPDLEAEYEASDPTMADVRRRLDDLLDAAAAVAEAHSTQGSASGFFVSVGLRGADLHDMLADASAALEAGDADRARDVAADVIETVENADDLGRRRVLTVGALAAGSVVIVVAAVLIKRRRKRPDRNSETDPSPATDETSPEVAETE